MGMGMGVVDMKVIQRKEPNLLIKELSESHIRFTGFAKQARRELKNNTARLFEALSFSKQVQALLILNHLGYIGSTKKNLTNLTVSMEIYDSDRIGNPIKNTDIDELIDRFDVIEEKNKHLYACVEDSADAGKDFEIENINVCSKCGFVLAGDTPGECMVCHSPKGYFRLF